MRQEQNSSICISIHALREEGDPTTPVTVRCMFLFLSTPSARRATMSGQGSFVPTEDFYPRPPRGGRRLLICAADLGGHISIHALREEGDNAFTANERAALLFLSTPSARRATRLNFRASSIVGYFYPRPPRGGRLLKNGCAFVSMNISIHALREEGDRSSTTKAPTGTISIHALREEGDLHSPAAMVLDRTISIHALREEGDGCKLRNLRDVEAISIHALREEGDWRVR